MKFKLTNIVPALIMLGVFGYLALTMYNFDSLTGRQYAFVMLIAGFMVGIFGKITAAIITAIIGLAAAVFTLFDKEKEDKDKIAPTQKV